MAFRKVWQFKEATYDYSSNGDTAANFYTDLPGGAMASRDADTMPSTGNTRKTITIPLDGIEGSLFRPELVPGAATQLRLFGGVVHARPIGVYIDGARGEIWTSQEMSLGV